MAFTTFIDVASGIAVLFGIFAVFRLLRLIADFVILIIAIAGALAACSMNLWYASMTEIFVVLPPQLDFTGRVICMFVLMLLGALLALPLAPFSLIVQHMGISGLNRRQWTQPDQAHRLLPGKNKYPAEKMHQWDSSAP